jgi:murein L,D-transpeptidase YcbB/YkuD
VIVGRPANPTPILRAEGAGVTINPPWTVPHSIAVKEILPKLKRNHAYLASQDMVLLDGPAGDPEGLHINWRAIPAGSFPYRVQQRPGPKNALGQVKLELPNKFDVYLHDTPGKAAFNAPQRDLSHGCVRVEQILPLASFALSASPDVIGIIQDGIGTGQTSYLPLKKKLPVYFLYWTAFAGADGAMQFRPDIYGRDQRLIAAINADPSRLAAGETAPCRRS